MDREFSIEREWCHECGGERRRYYRRVCWLEFCDGCAEKEEAEMEAAMANAQDEAFAEAEMEAYRKSLKQASKRSC